MDFVTKKHENSAPIPADVAKRLHDLIEAGKWRDSTTYAPIYQHSYILRNEQYVLFEALKKAIADYGYDGFFYKQPNRYLIFEGHRYWAYQLVLNRETMELFQQRQTKIHDDIVRRAEEKKQKLQQSKMFDHPEPPAPIEE